MAKAKKSESKSETPKKAAKPGKPATTSGNPMIDTSMAASDAAKMLVAGFKQSSGTNATASKDESAMFKQLKAGVNKPASSAMSSLLDKSHGPQGVKSHPSTKQVGRQQTFGADVNRSGVPRRTPG